MCSQLNSQCLQYVAILLNMNVTTDTNSQLSLIQQAIIEQWGLSKLTATEQLEILSEINELVTQRVVQIGLEQLTQPELDELNIKLGEIENANQDTIVNFISEKIPYFSQLVEREVVKIHSEVVKNTN